MSKITLKQINKYIVSGVISLVTVTIVRRLNRFKTRSVPPHCTATNFNSTRLIPIENQSIHFGGVYY